MFEFIKSLFRKNRPEETNAASKCPFLGHSSYTDEEEVEPVTVIPAKPKTTKPKKLKIVEPAAEIIDVTPAIAKGVKPAAKKTKKPTVKAEPANIVQFVQPAPAKKKGRPKKDTTV
jgi:hypothetical protein